MTDGEGKPVNRGGAPLGNRNALKHGFYARQMPGTEGAGEADLEDEIAMLRLSIRNILEHSVQPLNIEMQLELLHSISLAAAAINRLIKTQHYLGSLENPLADLMREALAEIRRNNPGTILDGLD